MYKLFVSGFNETLIDSEEAISISTMVEIDRIRQKGVIFTVATEDDLDSVLEYNRDFPFLDYIICYNGAFVYDVKKDKVIYRKNIGVSIVRKIIRLFSDYKICFYTSDNQYFFNNCISDRGSVGQFVEKNKKDVYKIEIECSRKRDESLEKESGLSSLEYILKKSQKSSILQRNSCRNTALNNEKRNYMKK